MQTYVYLWQYLAELFLEWKIFETKFVEKSNSTFHVQTFF
jgi:hypothetical protein